MWVQVACPRCYLHRSLNGIGKCVCGCLLIYRPSARRKFIAIDGMCAYQWFPDPEGPEKVHPDDGSKVTQERGRWLRCIGTRVEFPSRDRRRTAHPVSAREKTGVRFAG